MPPRSRNCSASVVAGTRMGEFVRAPRLDDAPVRNEDDGSVTPGDVAPPPVYASCRVGLLRRAMGDVARGMCDVGWVPSCRASDAGRCGGAVAVIVDDACGIVDAPNGPGRAAAAGAGLPKEKPPGPAAAAGASRFPAEPERASGEFVRRSAAPAPA